MKVWQPRRGTRTAGGQAIAEFALIVPFLLLIVIAVAEFGRIYTSLVAVEAAAREGADYGSFKASYWLVDAAAVPAVNNPPITTAEIERRVCTAAAGSHLENYAEPAGTVNHATCTNPSIQCTLLGSGGTPEYDCGTYPGGTCAVSATEPPCTVQVRVTYTFRPILGTSVLGWAVPTVTFTRVSTFRISDLPSS